MQCQQHYKYCTEICNRISYLLGIRGIAREKKSAMKLIIISFFVACSSAAKLNRAYLPPNHAHTSGGSSDFLQTPLSSSTNFNELTNQRNIGFDTKDTIAQISNDYTRVDNRYVSGDGRQNEINTFGNYVAISERPRAALERNAAVLRQTNDNDGETYSYAFETENGIVAEENGIATNGVEAQGGYSYTGDDGKVYSIRYTAGRNGFVPEGDHLPTSPPIPEEILLALEQNARDEAAGIYDDGSYNENKYANGENGYTTSYFGNNKVSGNTINMLNDDEPIVINSALHSESFGQQGSAIRNSNNIRNQVSTFADQQNNNGVNKAYLPPISKQTSPANQIGGSRFGNRNHQSSFSAENGYNY